MDLALGLLLRKTSSTPEVVPGAAPALAKAGVGGYIYIYFIFSSTSSTGHAMSHGGHP